MRESVRREKRRVKSLPQAGEAGRDASGAAVLPYGESLWGQEHYGEAGVRANMPGYDGFWPHRVLSANEIRDLAAQAAVYATQARGPGTLRAYRSAWRQYYDPLVLGPFGSEPHAEH